MPIAGRNVTVKRAAGATLRRCFRGRCRPAKQGNHDSRPPRPTLRATAVSTRSASYGTAIPALVIALPSTTNSFSSSATLPRNGRNRCSIVFYTKMLRDLNRKYGTKFVLKHLLHDGQRFFIARLSPAPIKASGADNAHWLKLAFHAYADQPGPPLSRRAAGKN